MRATTHAKETYTYSSIMASCLSSRKPVAWRCALRSRVSGSLCSYLLLNRAMLVDAVSVHEAIAVDAVGAVDAIIVHFFLLRNGLLGYDLR